MFKKIKEYFAKRKELKRLKKEAKLEKKRKIKEEKETYGHILNKNERSLIEQYNSGKILKVEVV